MAASGIEHAFGGPWTEIKLRAVSDYLAFYTQALKARPSAERPFQLWYVDAFAGTGDRTVETGLGRVRMLGSAKRALQVEPSFAHYVFVEAHAGRHKALLSLGDEHPNRDIRALRGDANQELLRLFGSSPWQHSPRAGLQRAVVFLDPYGMAVRWSTLKMLAATRRADVWYLFPLHAARRQLARDPSALDAGKRAKLTEIFGTPDWESEFYRTRQQPTDLFGFTEKRLEREVSATAIEQFARSRLETIFTFVSEPIPLLARHRLHKFSLFLVSGNPSKPAIDLIKKGVAAQVKKFGRG